MVIRPYQGPSKGILDLNFTDADRVYRTDDQIKYARKQAEELLGKKPDIKHWTQGAAYLMDTLAGLRYQNIAGDQATGNMEDATRRQRGSIGNEQPYGQPSQPQPSAQPPTASLPPQAAAELAALNPNAQPPAEPPSAPVPTPEKVMQPPANLGGPADATPAGGVPAMPGAPAEKTNPFDLTKKVAARNAATDKPMADGWTPVITPMFDDKARYNSRPRKPENITNLIFHHDTAKAENLVKYGRQVDKKRGFDPGYHYYIERDGSILQGTPHDKITNHMLPNKQKGINNGNSIGVVFAGSDSKNRPTEAQVKAAQFVGDRVKSEFKIPNENVYGHGEVNKGHRGADEGIEGVNLYRGKPNAVAAAQPPNAQPAAQPGQQPPLQTASLPTDPLAQPGMGLGGPKPQDEEAKMVRMAQAKGPPTDSAIAPTPPPPQKVPGYGGPPVSAPANIDQQQLMGIMAGASPSQYGDILKGAIGVNEPKMRDMSKPQQEVNPGGATPPTYHHGEDETVTIGGIPHKRVRGPDGRTGYYPAAGDVPGTAPGMPTDRKTNMNNAAEAIKDVAPVVRAGGNLVGQGNAASTAITADAGRREQDIDAGLAASTRSDALRRIKGLALESGTNLSRGSVSPRINDIKGIMENTFPGLITPGLKDTEVMNMYTSMLQKDAEKEMANRGNGARFEMVAAANPDYRTSLSGLKAMTDVNLQLEQQKQDWARQAIKHKNLGDNDYAEKKMQWFRENPITMETKDGKLYLQSFKTQEERDKVVPAGGLYLNSQNEIVRRKAKKSE